MSFISRGRAIGVLLAALVLVLLAILVGAAPYLKYTRGIYELLTSLLVADIAIALRGKWRDAATVIGATLFGIAAIELGSAALESGSEVNARGFSISRAVLGWGPSAPGVYHGEKLGPGGAVIYDADYTIDSDLLRHTLAASDGPLVAFFGDSMTFGQGLPDADTLPQIYADLSGPKSRVLNFGFPGYGPQHFLRALETGFFDPLLTNAKIFVYLTAPWHVERASCKAGFMARAPRYELRDGDVSFVGACAEGLNRVFQDVFMSGAALRRFVRPVTDAPTSADVELYLAELRRSAELVKQKYGARLIILYMAGEEGYLTKSGFTETTIKQRLQQSGLELVDVTLSASNFPPGTLLSIPGDGHPTAVANRARAALLQNYLANKVSAVAEVPQ